MGAYVTLTGIAEKEDDQYVSYCSQLGVASCGNTVEEALNNLGDALNVHLNALEEIGELEAVFREKSIQIQPGTPSREEVTVTISARPDQTFKVYQQELPLAEVA